MIDPVVGDHDFLAALKLGQRALFPLLEIPMPPFFVSAKLAARPISLGVLGSPPFYRVEHKRPDVETASSTYGGGLDAVLDHPMPQQHDDIRAFISSLRTEELLEFGMGTEEYWFLGRLTGHEISERLWLDEDGLEAALGIVDELVAKGELERDLFCARFKRPGWNWAQATLEF